MVPAVSVSLAQRQLIEHQLLERRGHLVDVQEVEILAHTISGSSDPLPPPSSPETAEVRGHHNWQAWADRNRGVPEGIGDLEFERGLDPIARPWFFHTDHSPGMTLSQIQKLRSEWLRTTPGQLYLVACEQSATRSARLKLEKNRTNEDEPEA
jgi:hypothetical protein